MCTSSRQNDPTPMRMRWHVLPIICLLRGYQVLISPLLHTLTGGQGGCRFFPSCSQYAIEAFSVYGWLRGTGLTLRRLMRCGPWSEGGYDPVPPKAECEPGPERATQIHG